MYSQAELIISIDTIVFIVDYNLMDKSTFNQLSKQYSIHHECNEWIITNNHGSSICIISNYIINNQIKTKINLFGISQIIGEQIEHNQLIKWIYELNHLVYIISIDIALDHFADYYKSIIICNDKSDIANQHNYSIAYITKFGVREIYIHTSNQIVINEIITKLKLSDNVSRTDSYYQSVERIIGKQFINYVKSSKGTHIKFNIKSSYEFHRIKDIIENEDITYDKQSYSDNQILIVNKSNQKTKIINYDKTERDNESEIKSQFILKKYSKLAVENDVNLSKIKHNRTEITIKKLKLDTRDTATNTTLMSRIKDEIDKLQIIIFKSKTERVKFQIANKRSRKLQNYKVRELQINDNDIINLVDNRLKPI